MFNNGVNKKIPHACAMQILMCYYCQSKRSSNNRIYLHHAGSGRKLSTKNVSVKRAVAQEFVAYIQLLAGKGPPYQLNHVPMLNRC